MNVSQLQRKTADLSRLASEADGLQKRYTAHMMLYDAACMAEQAKEIEQRRDECHSLLDGILDNAHAVHRLTREVQEIINAG